MLGQPVSMLIPEVIGFKLTGKLQGRRDRDRPRADRDADAAQEGRRRQVRRVLRPRPHRHDRRGPRHHRQHGAGIRRHLRLLPDRREDHRVSARRRAARTSASRSSRPMPRRRACGATPRRPTRSSRDTLALDLADVQPSLAGPKRPQDRVTLDTAKVDFEGAMEKEFRKAGGDRPSACSVDDANFDLGHGDVVIAAITSCTNTSNPSVMIGAGLLARNAVSEGPQVEALGEDLARARLADRRGVFRARPACRAISTRSASTSSASAAPPASAIPGRCRRTSRRRSTTTTSSPCRCSRATATSRAASIRTCARTISPRRRSSSPTRSPARCSSTLDAGSARHRHRTASRSISRTSGPPPSKMQEFIDRTITSELFESRYADVFTGDANWKEVTVEPGLTFKWDIGSTYVQNPPYFEGMTKEPKPVTDIVNARILGLFLDSITTDHISPAGNIRATSPGRQISAGAPGRASADFNQYGTRRGNHEIMMRGTFANIRIKNQMVRDDAGNVVEGGYTIHQPSGERMFIYDAAMRYQRRGRAARRPRRQGIRHRLVARLGGEGHEPARRPRRDRRELRAHPPLEPRRHGRRAVRVRGRHLLAVARPEGRRDDHHPRPRRRPQAAPAHGDGNHLRGRQPSGRVPSSAASIRSTSWNISATAASCTTSCASSRREARDKRGATTRKRHDD